MSQMKKLRVRKVQVTETHQGKAQRGQVAGDNRPSSLPSQTHPWSTIFLFGCWGDLFGGLFGC